MKRTGPNSFQFGDVKCSTHSISELLDEIRRLLSDRSIPDRTILCLNAHIHNLAYSDAALRRILNTTAIVAADGMSIVWSARLFGVRIPSRCNMTEAFRAFLASEDMPQTKAFLMGLSHNQAQEAAAAIEEASGHCHVAGAVSGYLSEREYRELFASLSDVDFVFLGMGTPRTEQMSLLVRETCPRAIVWGIGGGTLKILAGMMSEAPALVRRSGLQWLYRLSVEPIALWRRYVIGNPLFIVRVVRASLRARRP